MIAVLKAVDLEQALADLPPVVLMIGASGAGPPGGIVVRHATRGQTSMVDPLTITEATRQVADLADKVGVIERVKQKLVSQPDPAAARLATVLAELQKTALLIDQDVNRFLAVSLQPGEMSKEDRDTLLELAGTSIYLRYSGAATHCAKINNIHQRFLQPWFQKVTGLNAQEREALVKVFADLSEIDASLVEVINTIGKWVQERAGEVRTLVEGGRAEDAERALRAAWDEIQPVRQSLGETISRMRSLEADFIVASRAV